jgi:hypothetical protein
MRSFQTAALVAVLVMAAGLGLFVAARKMLGPGSLAVPGILTSLGATLEEPGVLVLVVQGPNQLEQIRRSIAGERVIAASRDAFALAEGRIVTTRIEAAGPVISEAGWVHRELEFVDARDVRLLGAAGSAAEASREAEEDHLPPAAQRDPSDLSDLYAKDYLTVGEALRVLKHGP